MNFSKKLLDYYDKNKRLLPWRLNPSPYRVWVSEIMLQQTRAGAVVPYYEHFLQALPDVKSLSLAPDNQLNKLWQGLGYYSRVKNMKIAAQEIMEKHQGKIPSNYDELLELKGIGPYTAGAIASIAFNQPVPAIDGNLLRIYSRLYCVEESIDNSKGKKKIFDLVKKDIPDDRPGDFNQALMDLGSGICLPKTPRCSSCPIGEFCLAYKENRQTNFPIRKDKTRKKIEDWTIIILERSGSFLIQQRPSQGLLANLWQFPQLQGHLDKENLQKYLDEKGYIANTIKALPPSQHIFSHKIWNMEAYFVRLNDHIIMEEEASYDSSLWVSPIEIEKVYPFASAIGKYVEEVLTWNG